MIAIAEDRVDEALAAIEQARGKIDVLLSRNPETALIPVHGQVNLIDTAPQDVEDIAFLKNTAETALDLNDLPKARTLLDFLRSEIRVRTYHLPLATYPAAVQEAARLLDQKKTREAGTVPAGGLEHAGCHRPGECDPAAAAKESAPGAPPWIGASFAWGPQRRGRRRWRLSSATTTS